ncbi:ABC transporter ATP-binding protein [Lampropedia aestuarii]|uniref:ABC transporter ATP-binding protein n=1 Tax=Lampropedia aestuarii TaxID=2562762 RepID=A0A4S5BRM7_9BURK|nr:ABC transporter ATP-binding protein [Lampropedia aestuarii]MDH5858022.1 ABC transporter ATP-binding protein [Lampropedia aestuarii]THJ33671.1 ABC transporter ATP-binding protein [Lampropedia aestuarii]
MAQLNPYKPPVLGDKPLLQLKQLRRSYGHQAVVKDLDLQVSQGQFLALLGPSGCGKTTTLRMVAGFEQPDAGSIHLDGVVLANATHSVPAEQRGMGMVFQSYALWPHMTVGDNVGYALKLRGVKGQDYGRAIEQALAQVELAEKRDAMPHELSGGQKQRVALARCIAAEPRVILLDEPLANLDRHLRHTMEDAFRRLHRQSGATLIYVTHDQAEAMALADEVAVMHQGQLVQRGTPQQIYRQPRTPWLARFIGQGSVLKAEACGALANMARTEGQCIADSALLHQAIRWALPDSRKAQRQILVRPEHVRVLEPSPHADGPAPDSLAACVVDCVFKGERYQLMLRLAHAAEPHLMVFSHKPHAIGALVGVVIEQAWTLVSGA